ncbi:hypothetical protein FPV23_03725 [Carnobacterium sp. PL17RED31]|nr:hypothetical protein FPV23_03725 [Carnobacterium sp. PL17RED31]
MDNKLIKEWMKSIIAEAKILESNFANEESLLLTITQIERFHDRFDEMMEQLENWKDNADIVLTEFKENNDRKVTELEEEEF